MTPVFVRSAGLWTPGYPSFNSWLRGERDDEAARPAPTIVNPRHLRFASLLTKMAIATFEEAIEGQVIEVSDVNVLFASSQGEIQIAVDILQKVAEEGATSPARFMNSVHNTVPGHISIATKSHGYFSALAGGPQTVSAAITEAMCLLSDSSYDHVVVIVGDESLPDPFGPEQYDSLAAALLLARSPGARDLARLSGLRLDPSAAPLTAQESLKLNPCSPILAVLEAIRSGTNGLVRIDGPGAEGWCVEVQSCPEQQHLKS